MELLDTSNGHQHPKRSVKLARIPHGIQVGPKQEALRLNRLCTLDFLSSAVLLTQEAGLWTLD